MKQNNVLQYTLLTGCAMLAVAFARLAPHPFNFTPVAALALYGGARGKNTAFSFLLPLLVMVFSDVLVMQFLYPENGNPLAYFTTKDALGVYLAFAVVVGIGLLLKRKITVPTVIVASLASSFFFYAITNFVTWYASPFYPQTFAGLMGCYTAGIPFYNNDPFGSFFLNQFVGDLFFSAVLFGAHAWVVRATNRTAQA